MAAQNYNKWDSQPRILSDEEIANPMKVVYEVFDYAHLPDLRNTLWEWLKMTVSGNFNKRSLHYKDRESLLAFYEKIQKLLEASHLLLVAQHLTAPAKQSNTDVSSRTKNNNYQQLVPAIELVPIIDKLVALLSPEYLFEMGSLQELHNPTPLYFFLLVLPNTTTRTYAECQMLAENACAEWGTVQLIMIKQNELQKHLQEEHLLYATICKKHKLVYAKEGQVIPLLNTCKLPEKVAEAKTIFNASLAQAQGFYDGAMFYFQQPNYPLAVFMLQQVIEHCLRGFLQAVIGRNTVTHDLVLLRRHALPFFPGLMHLLPVEKDKQLCLLYQASKAYVQARYERDFAMPRTEISRLKGWVEALVPATLQAFEQWVGQGSGN
jgi:HEPN domain-containing protein